MKIAQTLSVAALAVVGSAHTTFLQLIVEGTTYPIGYGIPVPSYDGPVTDVTQPYLACNGGAGPNPTTPSANIINVKAGDTVQAVWRHTLSSTPANDAIYVVDPSHKGPTLAYLKQANNGSTDGPGGGWFKIQQAGLNVATQDWAVTDLIANGGYHSITIPTCIPNGRYLLRAELIALHAAGSPQGAQLYMECAQINVSGGTGAAVPSTVSLPGAYAATDPGLLINIYQSLSTYHIPGPTPFVCGGTQPSSTAPASTLVTSVQSSTTSKPASTPTSIKATSTLVKPSSTTSSKAATSSSAGAPLYGQCGGTGWTGPTTCASGTCTVSSAYYSQCLP